MLVTIGSAASSGGLLQIRIGPVPAMPAGYVGNPIVTVRGAITTPTVRGAITTPTQLNTQILGVVMA